jgi:hypothetical protein
VPSAGNTCQYGVFWYFGISSTGVELESEASMLPASKAFAIVVPEVMIDICTVFSFAGVAPPYFGFLTSTRDASCFHEVSLNGPSVTAWFGSVYLLPYLSTAGL